MKSNIGRFAFIACILFATTAFAESEAPIHSEQEHEHEHEHMQQPPTWEISGGANLSFVRTSSANADAANELHVVGDIAYFLLPQLELGLRTEDVISFNSGNTVTELLFLLGPTFNFSTDVDNSFFVSARVGVALDYPGKLESNSSTFAYYVSVGKRFQLAHHIAYMPEIGFLGSTSSTADGENNPAMHNWEIIPVQFSLTF